MEQINFIDINILPERSLQVIFDNVSFYPKSNIICKKIFNSLIEKNKINKIISLISSQTEFAKKLDKQFYKKLIDIIIKNKSSKIIYRP